MLSTSSQTTSRWLLLLALVVPSLALGADDEADSGEIRLAPQCTPFKSNRRWLNTNIQRLSDGRLMIPSDNGLQFAGEDMASWSPPMPILTGAVRAAHPGSLPTGGATVIETAAGHWVIAWRDGRKPDALADYWDKKKNEPVAGATAHVWTSISRDKGVTWSQPEAVLKLPGGYPPKKIIETRKGTLLMPIQYHERGPGRNVIVVARSTDQGATWEIAPSKLDVGGTGAHDGALEPTLVELKNGAVWILFRTSQGRLWQSFSVDDGATWSPPVASGISASSSPPYIDRLRDGRLLLVWNLERPSDGSRDYPIRGGDSHYSLTRTSWWRQELAAAVSTDDGRSWSKPSVVARHAKRNGRISYPYFFETSNGHVLIFANQGKVEASLPLQALGAAQ